MTRKIILLIDDDQSLLENLGRELEQAGYDVMTATDGRQGLSMALVESPDLVILDLLLFGLDGFKVCSRLREDARYIDLPIIILSDVFITVEDLQGGLKLGDERFSIKADACLAKPPVYEQILEKIRVLLGETSPAPVSENSILVVDEDSLNRELLRLTLNDDGYFVVTAVDGEEGWAYFQSHVPLLVLLGVQSRGLEELEILERIRARTSDVAVIVMATSGSEASATQALERGADGYFVRPLQRWQILHAVKENLEKARQRRLCRKLRDRLHRYNARLLEEHRALQAQQVVAQETYECFQEAELMQQNMVSMMVHDLKNPLNVILISIDLLASEFGEVLNQEQRDILSSANMASQQMLRLISNLLELERLEDGKVPVHLELLDLVQVLKLTVGQAQLLANQKGITLNFSVADTLPPVPVDVDLTSRVVANLLDNAIKFTPLNGKIEVAIEVKDDKAVVSVTDNGLGVPPDQRERIFEKFAQVDQGPRRGKASVGLGLAFCKLAVEAQGGRIWVESAPGSGSQFKFTLPVRQRF